MSTTIKITGWLLMTVMHSGVLSTARFPTEALCKDGESLSRYGKTVAEVEHDKMVSRVAHQVDQALWDFNNPRHEPVTDEEWKAVREIRNLPSVYVSSVDGKEYPWPWPRLAKGDPDYWEVYEDGTIQKYQKVLGIDSSTSYAMGGIGPTDWITTTRCVPIPDEFGGQ